MEPLYCGTSGTWRSVLYTAEPLYCGHLGDLVECPVYSGITLLRAPWGPGGVSCIQRNHSIVAPRGPGGVSCIQRNHSIVGTSGTWWSVLYTAESLYCGHLGDLVECPVYSGTTLLWHLGDLAGVLYTAEPLYCGHLGDLVECPVYSGITLLWAPRGPGGVSCIQWNHSIVGTSGTWRSVLYTAEPLYCGHLGDLVECPVYSGITLLRAPWEPGEVSCIERCPHFRGKFTQKKHSLGHSEVSLIMRCLYFRGVL